MSKNAFFILREIDSLRRMQNQHSKLISSENDRIRKLEQKRLDSQNEYLRLKSELSSTNNRLNDIDLQLTRERLAPDLVTKLEAEGLELLSKAAELEEKINDCQTFISGISNTIKEIAEEVGLENKGQEFAIENIHERIAALESELPAEFKNIYLKTMALHLPVGIFTCVENQACKFCRRALSRIEDSEIEVQHQIKTCPGCKRIFLPSAILH